ncbi:SUKH-4 family immunity protein [Streptomyces sp. NPDC008001]|uniref:SUKH-4 family immunity protein n=1 Tax=Streptomyces sp. NPDC008001 TaxID=3364804 RepID=UPI0036EDB5DD
MSVAITVRDWMEQYFDIRDLVRIPPDAIAPGVTDAATREFLSGVGLPEIDMSPFVPDEQFSTGMRTLAELCPEELRGLPARCGEWLLLGHFMDIPYALDGTTGTVHAIGRGCRTADSVTRPAHRDLLSLAHALRAVRQHLGFLEDQEFAVWPDDIDAVLDALIADLTQVEPDCMTHPAGIWPPLIEDIRAM